MNRRKSKIIFLSVCLASLFFLSVNARCLAITISPPVMELSGRRGEDLQARLKVRNDSLQVKLYYLSVENFEAEGEQGQALIGGNQINYSLPSWIELPASQLIMNPGEEAEIVFNIKIPETAEPGGHYASITLADAPPYLMQIENSNVRIGSKIGGLILVRVEGEVKEQIELVEFKISSENKFYSHLPIEYFVRLKNTGNVHLKPTGEVILTNLFGRKVKGVASIEIYDQPGNLIQAQTLDGLPVNLEGGNVLPNSVRRFETVWAGGEMSGDGFWSNSNQEFKDFKWGRYKSRLELEYGEKGILTAEGPVVWVVPWRILLTGLMILLLVVVVFSFFRRSRK